MGKVVLDCIRIGWLFLACSILQNWLYCGCYVNWWEFSLTHGVRGCWMLCVIIRQLVSMIWLINIWSVSSIYEPASTEHGQWIDIETGFMLHPANASAWSSFAELSTNKCRRGLYPVRKLWGWGVPALPHLGNCASGEDAAMWTCY